MNKKKIMVCIGVISVVIIVVIAVLFLTLTKKQMVFVSGGLCVSALIIRLFIARRSKSASIQISMS